MSLLTLVQGACARIGLDTPSTVIGNTDAIVKDMLYLARQSAISLSRKTAWKSLTSEKTFSTTAAAEQTGALPSDVDWIIPDTMFNRTLTRRVAGPLSAEEWQLLQASLSAVVDPFFRIRGTSLLFVPAPAAGNTVAYEYVTKNFCQSSGGTAQSAFAADTDTTVLDEELHMLNLVWRFRRAKGLDYSQELADFELEMNQAILREGVRPRISTDASPRSDKGGDVIAGAKPNAIVTEGGDYIVWD